jgi:hypothetical protein
VPTPLWVIVRMIIRNTPWPRDYATWPLLAAATTSHSTCSSQRIGPSMHAAQVRWQRRI